MTDILGGYSSVGMVALRTQPTAAIAVTETSVISTVIPPNTLVLGSTYRVMAFGVQTNTTFASSSAYNIRLGPTTLTGAIIASQTILNVVTARTNMALSVVGFVTVRSAGANGTAIGFVTALGGSLGTAPGAGLTTALAINTTVANTLEFTYASGAASTTATFHNATIEVIR